MDDVEDFESQFADELDMLDEIEDGNFDEESSKPRKSRRSLHFMTPGKPHTSSKDTPADDINTSIVTSSAKRKASLDDSPPLEYNDEVIEEIISTKPPEKRAKTRDLSHIHNDPLIDDFQLSPPRSQSVVTTTGSSYRATPQIKKRIPDGDFFSVTGIAGDRVYMSVLDEHIISQQIDETSHQSQTVNLLSVPYYSLKQQVLNQKDEALQREADDLHNLFNNYSTNEPANDERDITTKDINNNLWVEKYSPLNYTDLLSDETVNRSLLQWIKLWDHVVFHKDLPKKPKEAANKKEKKFVKKNEIEVTVELDKHKRPLQKVVLLCGPPGLGKTTLAHIIARHAGYKPVEMNASDDRSADLFKKTLESSTQMKSVLGVDRRPNCLIIDEIDGAPVAAINMLLSIIKYPEGATKKSKNSQILFRPIICICNDIYVPALRELKKIALVLTFPQTAPQRLASRLHQVAGEERLKADMNSLLVLCEKSDNDIRSCLNTLQFLHRRHTEINMRLIQNTSIGHKDSQKTLFSVWHDIFTIRRPKRARLGALSNEQEKKLEASRWQQANTQAARFEHILGVVHAAGDYNKVNQGLYENYLEAKSKDPHLHGLVLSTDWLCFVDHINQYVSSTQDYSPIKYIPYMAVTFHLIYGSNTYPKIQYPHTEFEHKKTLSKCNGLISGLLCDMVPSVRHYFDPSIIVMDLLPSLLVIIQPILRPVNTQLYSEREKSNLLHLVNIMIAYNLTYKQEKQPDMQYNYALEPNMEDIARFEGVKTNSQKPLTYAAKQVIAREVDLEKMRRSEEAYCAGPSIGKKNMPNKLVQNTGSNYIQRPKPTTIKEEKPVRDFFGQIIKKDPSKANKEEKRNILATDVWFHFKEGFSNAVRRNVRVKDFL